MYVLICGTLFLNTTIFGYIYQRKRLRRWLPAQQQYQYIIGLGDFHDKQLPIGEIQRNAIISSSAQLPSEQTLVLTEDLSCSNTDGKQRCGRFLIHSNKGVLASCTDQLRNNGVKAHNFEYRYCRVVSLGPLLHQTNDSISCMSTQEITLGALFDEIKHIVVQVAQYRDGSPLDQWYAHEVKTVSMRIAQLSSEGFVHRPIGEYIRQRTNAHNRTSFLQHLLTFDSGLFDCRLVHTIFNDSQHNSIIILAGGTHINNISKRLMNAGFELVDENKVTCGQKCNLTQCLGSHIVKGQFCVRPQPIDPQELAQTISRNSSLDMRGQNPQKS